MKKSDYRNRAVRKAVSLLLTACFCASAASCGTEPSESTTESTPVTTTSETTTVTTTSETTTETTETEPAGPDFSKSITYNLFPGTIDDMTISMNVNIDEYITSDGDKEVFELYRLASDLGWLEKGAYTYDDYIEAVKANPDQTKIGHSNWFEYKYGDHRAVFTISEYIEDIDKLCYLVSGQHCVCSREDAIIIAYGLWFFSVNPDDCTVYRDDFKRFNTKKGIQIS